MYSFSSIDFIAWKYFVSRFSSHIWVNQPVRSQPAEYLPLAHRLFGSVLKQNSKYYNMKLKTSSNSSGGETLLTCPAFERNP